MKDPPVELPDGTRPEKKGGWSSFIFLIVSFLLIVAIKNSIWPRTQPPPTTLPAVTLETKAAVMQKVTFEYDYVKPESNVMRAFFVIHNRSSRNVEDFVITCWLYGPGGTGIDKVTQVIDLNIGIGETKYIPPFDMGLIDPQTSTAACYITDLVLN